MRILADECCAAGLVAMLREAGHDVRYVAETHRGIDDETVMALAESEERVVVTVDKDFAAMALTQGRPAAGIVLLRLHPARKPLAAMRLGALIKRYGSGLAGHYTVVQEDRFRLRPLHRMD